MRKLSGSTCIAPTMNEFCPTENVASTVRAEQVRAG